MCLILPSEILEKKLGWQKSGRCASILTGEQRGLFSTKEKPARLFVKVGGLENWTQQKLYLWKDRRNRPSEKRTKLKSQLFILPASLGVSGWTVILVYGTHHLSWSTEEITQFQFMTVDFNPKEEDFKIYGFHKAPWLNLNRNSDGFLLICPLETKERSPGFQK